MRPLRRTVQRDCQREVLFGQVRKRRLYCPAARTCKVKAGKRQEMRRVRRPGGAGKRERENQAVLLKRLQAKGVPTEEESKLSSPMCLICGGYGYAVAAADEK
jgi:hypothetical protein